MSVRTAKRSPSETRPIATPATGALIGTPASISARVPPQTVAMDEEPLDSRMSDTMRTVYGKASSDGSIGESDRRARLPWPMSRREGPRMNLVSPTEKGGKL